MKTYFTDLFDLSVGVRRMLFSEMFYGFGVGVFSMLLNLHLLALGVNEKEIGKVISIGGIAVGIACLPSVFFANYFGRKKILSAGAILMAMGCLISGFSREIWAFYLAQIILSCGVTFVITTEIQLTFSYCRAKSEESKSYNLLFATYTLFVGIGTLAGGFLPRIISGFTSNYQGSLFCAAIALLLGGILRFFWLPRNENEIHAEKKNNFKSEDPQKGRRKQLVLFTFFALLAGFTNGWVFNFLNIIVKFRLGWQDEMVSVLLSCHGFFLFAGSLAVPFLLSKWGVTKSFILIFIINIILALVLYTNLPFPFFVSFLLCRGGIALMLNNMIASQSMSATEETDRNLFAGLWSIAVNLGASIATYFAGIILMDKNYFLPFLLTAITVTISFIYYFYWIKPIFLNISFKKNNTEANILE